MCQNTWSTSGVQLMVGSKTKGGDTHIHLMYLIGFRNRLVVGFQWLVYLTTFQRGARLITFEDAIHYQ
jgi:hypothetical protein